MNDLSQRAATYTVTRAMQGTVPVVLYSCFHCQCYIGKCTAASFPEGELPVCKTCREQLGYGDRPVMRDEWTMNGHLDDDAPAITAWCGECECELPLDGNNIGGANLCHECYVETCDERPDGTYVGGWLGGEPPEDDSRGPNPCVCGRQDQCTYWESPCPYRF